MKLFACFVFALALPVSVKGAEPVTITVDAADVSRRILHAHLTIPANAGPLTLHYPKWIPGEHSPSGPINNLAGLTVTANGKSIQWQRDPIDLYTFKVEVPPGARAIEVGLDYLAPVELERHSSGATATDHVAIVNWNLVVVYPGGARADEIPFRATLKLPPGWSWGSALASSRSSGATVEFKQVPLTTLIDSPVLIGDHLQHIALDPLHEIVAAADGESALDWPNSVIEHYKRLIVEATALFGARHYDSYHFLVSLSDFIPPGGIEHHQSSDNRAPERAFVDEEARLAVAGLLPHEFAHSWNGKYRRPIGLIVSDYQQPMKDDLLWVYEGLTSYLGTILAARAGLWTPQETRDVIAFYAGDMDATQGRKWRPLADTAVAAPSLYDAPLTWRHWRRGVDFYPEGVLLWLEIDGILRKESNGARSLDDFCRKFHGGENGPPAVVPYQLDDVVNTLNAIVPHDWRKLIADRLDSPQTRLPMQSLEEAGWRLSYTDARTPFQKAREGRMKQIDLLHSIGVLAHAESADILDVLPDGPAARAGIGPGMKLIAVNGRKFTPERLREAVHLSKTTPVELLVQNGDYMKTHKLDYKGGDRFPHLDRNGAKPDLLTSILSPSVKRAEPVKGTP